MEKFLTVSIQLDNKSGRIAKVNDNPKGQRTKKLPCIYAILYRKRIIRLGETSAGYSRIRSGFNQKLRHNNSQRNYYAYKWRERYKGRKLELMLFSLPKRFGDKSDAQCWRRALEAELAWEFRKVHGGWPTAMTEIHFDEQLRRKKTIQKEIDSFFKLFN
jgi:hypothetical protein